MRCWVTVSAVAGCVLAAGARAEPASQPSSDAAGGLDLGKYHACARLPGASIRCWGYGGDGALGYAGTATIGDDETPAAAGPVDLGAGRTARALSAGAVHSCALLDDGSVRCWGFGGDGRLGYANTQTVGDDETPGSAGPVDLGRGRTAKAITAGRAHSCAVLDEGSVRCWGFGFAGRLGYGNTNSVGDDEAPGAVGPVRLGALRTAKAITAGEAHTCALLDDGSVRCWGYGGNGQLGYANTSSVGDDEAPDTVGPVKLGPGRTAVAIAAGDFHTCAVLDDGSVRCWGYGGNGRLGYANRNSVGVTDTPADAGPVDLGAGHIALAISAGADHTCALLDGGSVRCWGFGGGGRLGYANTESVGDDETPGSVGPVDLGPGRSAVAISAGGSDTCARLDDGSLRCWGDGANGRLGSCNTNAIGDDETPGSAGPIDLGVPGIGGAGCAAPPASEVAPGGGRPAGSSDLTVDPGTSPGLARLARGPGDVVALAAQKLRAIALRGCLRRASAGARRARRRARIRCRRRYGRTPGRVSAIHAKAVGRHTIRLTFEAAGTDHAKPPAAHQYLVKQSRRRIRSRRDFRRAHPLCEGACSFRVTSVGATISLTVTGLRPRRTYYYVVAARDNVSARAGPRSRSVRATTS